METQLPELTSEQKAMLLEHFVKDELKDISRRVAENIATKIVKFLFGESTQKQK